MLFATHFRLCLYNVTEAGNDTEPRLNKAFSYSVDGKTLTTLKLSGGAYRLFERNDC